MRRAVKMSRNFARCSRRCRHWPVGVAQGLGEDFARLGGDRGCRRSGGEAYICVGFKRLWDIDVYVRQCLETYHLHKDRIVLILMDRSANPDVACAVAIAFGSFIGIHFIRALTHMHVQTHASYERGRGHT